jgi:hypothetical protein
VAPNAESMIGAILLHSKKQAEDEDRGVRSLYLPLAVRLAR